MLWQSGSFRENQDVDERVMDSMRPRAREGHHDPRQEHRGPAAATTKINIVDTPGHADFGGEVERGLTMVDGVLLLVDASEGPLPQTRFVLRKALELRLPVVLVVNKVDRPDARVEEVVNEVYELFLDLDATETQIEFPIVYANARDGQGRARPGRARRRPRAALRDAARDDPAAVVRPRASAAGARHEPRREPVRRPARAAADPPRHAAQGPADRLVPRRTATIENARVTELYITEALDRVPADEAGPGEIVALAGLPEVTIGETIADPDDPRPLPVTTSTSRASRSRSGSTRARSPAPRATS